jgi:hypothetical protein
MPGSTEDGTSLGSALDLFAVGRGRKVRPRAVGGSVAGQPTGRAQQERDQQAAYQPSYLPPWATGTTLRGSQVRLRCRRRRRRPKACQKARTRRRINRAKRIHHAQGDPCGQYAGGSSPRTPTAGGGGWGTAEQAKQCPDEG